MRKIAFINSSVDKYSTIKLWTTDLMKSVMGNNITMMPKLVSMVFAAITPDKYEFQYIDEEIDDIDYDSIDADLIAITAMTVQAKRAYQIADEMRKRGKTVVMGGIHASVLGDEVLEHCDAIMVGEGENTWPELLKDWESNTLKKIYNAKDYPFVDKLISPKVDIIKFDHYLQFPIQATRGCPYDCEFCSIKFSSGRKYRMKPVKQVVEEIKEFEKHNKGIFKKGYFFVDDNLYVNREYTKELFTALKDLNITWQGQGTIDATEDDEILKLMAESGCRNFSIGFESISQSSLEEANKPKFNIADKYSKALNKIASYGIIPAGTFIFGFDSDDISVFSKTVGFAVKQHIYSPFFNILTPLPGTRFFKRMEGENRIKSKDWNKYNALNCVFSPKKMTSEQLQEGSYWASIEIADMNIFREHLDYFWEKGPWDTNPRLKLYERILLFAFGIKFWRNKDYRKFLFWSSRQKNAADFNTIVQALLLNDMAKQLPESHDPALSMKDYVLK